jgi:hypothetical protein
MKEDEGRREQQKREDTGGIIIAEQETATVSSVSESEWKGKHRKKERTRKCMRTAQVRNCTILYRIVWNRRRLRFLMTHRGTDDRGHRS